MLNHYLKIAFRNLFRYKFYSCINIGGLAIGIACCLIIFLYVRSSLRYDTHHPHADRIYRIVSQATHENRQSWYSVTPPALTPALNKDFPEVENAFRLFLAPNTLVENGQRKFYEEKFFLADSSILQVLNLPLRYGNPQTALQDPSSVIISEAVAQKYFGPENPVGKVLTVNKNTIKVTGVLAESGKPTHLKLDFLAVLDKQAFGERINSWVWQQFYTYILLREGSNAGQFEAKLGDYVQKTVAPITQKSGVVYTLYLQPLKDIYLRSSHLEFDQPERGNINYVYAFSVIAVFILVIACFNFMNLATARSLKRAREVGVRKVIGAYRSQLIRQFLGESMLLTLIAFALAIPIVALALPYFNQLSDESLSLQYPMDLRLVFGLFLASIPVGILAGLYPVFFLSSFRPIVVLKSAAASAGYSLSALRKGLVIVQFVISVVLIAATAIVYRQLNYLQQKNLGFNKDQTLVMSVPIAVGLPGEKAKIGYEPLKTELLRNPAVLAVAASYGDPGGLVAGDGIRIPGEKTRTSINMFTVDYDYIPALKMELVAGRAFSREFPTDEQQAFILNETAVKDLGFGTPDKALGKEIAWDEWLTPEKKKNGKVIGIVKDFHYKSLHQKIEPFLMHVYPGTFNRLTVRIRPENTAATLADIQNKWHAFMPEYPLQYRFLDETFAKMIEKERKMSQVVTIFSGLAIFIACLGLLGLVAFTAQQRTKEIGIRKVMGASVPQIMVLLSRDFTRLVLIAIVLAVPIAWYGMHRWLQDFAYRIDISWGVFAGAGIAALLIALVTVSFQAIKAAVANPVKALRNE